MAFVMPYKNTIKYSNRKTEKKVMLPGDIQLNMYKNQPVLLTEDRKCPFLFILCKMVQKHLVCCKLYSLQNAYCRYCLSLLWYDRHKCPDLLLFHWLP